MTAVTDVAARARPSVRVEPGRLEPGERGQIVVTLDIPSGCHIQSHTPRDPFLIPTTLQLIETSDVTFGPVVYPPAHTQRFDWTPVELDVYRGTVDIVIPVEVAASARAGITTIAGRVRYQGCTETACLPPVEESIEAPLVIQADVVRQRAVGRIIAEPRRIGAVDHVP